MIQLVIQVIINYNANYNISDDTSGNTKDDTTENTRDNTCDDRSDNANNDTSKDWFHSSDHHKLAEAAICTNWYPELSWLCKSLSSVKPSIFGKQYKLILTDKTVDLWILQGRNF